MANRKQIDYLLSLGSNLGDRKQMIADCIKMLKENEDLALKNIKISSLYESPALLPDDAPKDWDSPFLNAVLSAKSEVTPQDMLSHIEVIEKSLGKIKRGHWGPRNIDIDILSAGDIRSETYSLTLPHPSIQFRDFVLIPLAEIAPDWEHPTLHLNAEQMLDSLGKNLGSLKKHSTIANNV